MDDVVSIFSGGGGLDLGLTMASGTLTKAYDWSADACRNYSKIFPDHVIEQVDLSQLDPRAIKSAEMLIGGPPCQAFSEGNAARPGESSELNMWPTTIEIVRAKRPDRFLFENVRGLVRDHRAYFETILAAFKALGYQVDWRVLNAADYGVPQTRHRVFIAGWLPGLERWQWPKPTHHNGAAFDTRNGGRMERWVSWDEALTDWLKREHEPSSLPKWIQKKVCKALSTTAPFGYYLGNSRGTTSRLHRDLCEPAFTVVTDQKQVCRVNVPVELTLPDGLYNCRDYNKSRHWRDVGQPAFNVMASGDHGRERVKIESVIYKLDREARCLLQTLPTFIDDNKCIGNAVPPLLARRIFEANRHITTQNDTLESAVA